MTRSFLLPILLFLFWLVSCNPDPVTPLSIPQEVQPFVDSFEEEAAKRGVSLDIDELIIEYGTDLESSSGGEAIGQCFVPNRRNPIPRIVLDTTSFSWRNNELSRELVIFHELGHCILNRLQHRDDQLSNGNFASLMITSANNIYGPKLNYFKREYYLDELFDPTTPEPDWAKDIPEYNSLTATRAPIFIDEFDDNRAGWPVISNGKAEGSIENGEFRFASKVDDQAFFAAVSTTLYQEIDYEIETTLKITSGDNLALLEWGGTNASDFFFIGFSNDGFMYSGQWEVGYSNIIELPNFDPNGFNKLTIRKIGDFYYIYVNESFVEIYQADEIPGNLVGYYVGSQTELATEYLRVYELR